MGGSSEAPGLTSPEGVEKVIHSQPGTLYYRIQVGRSVQISPEFQFIRNPGFNTDRGPVEFAACGCI